jgi:hypothetical protein
MAADSSYLGAVATAEKYNADALKFLEGEPTEEDIVQAQMLMAKYSMLMTAITNMLKTESDAQRSIAANMK